MKNKYVLISVIILFVGCTLSIKNSINLHIVGVWKNKQDVTTTVITFLEKEKIFSFVKEDFTNNETTTVSFRGTYTIGETSVSVTYSDKLDSYEYTITNEGSVKVLRLKGIGVFAGEYLFVN